MIVYRFGKKKYKFYLVYSTSSNFLLESGVDQTLILSFQRMVCLTRTSKVVFTGHCFANAYNVIVVIFIISVI